MDPTINSIVNQHAESIFTNAQFQVIVPNHNFPIMENHLNSPRLETAIFDQTINVYLIASIPNTQLSPQSPNEDYEWLFVLEQFAASLDISVQVSIGDPILPQPDSCHTNQLHYSKHFFHQSTVNYNRREPGCAPIINPEAGYVAFRLFIPIAYVDEPPNNTHPSKVPISMLFSISQQMLTVATTPSTYPINFDSGTNQDDSDIPANTPDSNNLLAGLNEIDPVFKTARLSISKPRSILTPTLVNDPVHLPAIRRVLTHSMTAVCAIDLSAATLPQRVRDDAILIRVHLENVLPVSECTSVTVLSMTTQCLMHRDDVPVDLHPVCHVLFPVVIGHGDQFDYVYSYIMPVALNATQSSKEQPSSNTFRYTQHPSGMLLVLISLVYTLGTNGIGSDNMHQQVMASKWECALTNPLPLFRPLLDNEANKYPESFIAPPLPTRARIRSPSPTRAPTIQPDTTHTTPGSPNKNERKSDLKPTSGRAERLSMTDEAILTMTRTFSQLRKSVMAPNLPVLSSKAHGHTSSSVQSSRRASVDVIPSISEIKEDDVQLVDHFPEQISGVDLTRISAAYSQESMLDNIPPHQLANGSSHGGVLIVTLSLVRGSASPCIKVGDEFMLDVQLINHMSKPCAYSIEVPQLISQYTHSDALPNLTSGPILMDPYQFAVAASNVDATLPAIICLEQYVRVSPINPKQVASIRIRFQALRPGVHSVGTIDLVDMLHVGENGLRPKIEILDALSVLIH